MNTNYLKKWFLSLVCIVAFFITNAASLKEPHVTKKPETALFKDQSCLEIAQNRIAAWGDYCWDVFIACCTSSQPAGCAGAYSAQLDYGYGLIEASLNYCKGIMNAIH